MVALPGNVNLCNDCVDLAAEIVHDEDHLGGTVRVATKDLEELRRQASQGNYVGIWLDGVREAVQRADAHLKSIAGGFAEHARRDFVCWYLNTFGETPDLKEVAYLFQAWCAARGVNCEEAAGLAVATREAPQPDGETS